MNLEKKVEVHGTEKLSISNFSGNSRFIVIEESASYHCCFQYSVIDTQKGNDGETWDKNICEIFEKEEALLICYLLNKHFNKIRVRFYPKGVDETFDGTVIEETKYSYLVIPDDNLTVTTRWNKKCCEVLI